MKTVKKILALLVVFSVLLSAVSAVMSVSAANKYGEIEGVPVVDLYVIRAGRVIKINSAYKNEHANSSTAELAGTTESSVKIEQDEDDPNSQQIVVAGNAFGVNLIYVCEYFRHNGVDDFLQHYYIIVVVETDEVKVADMGEIYDVDVPDISMKFKAKAMPKAELSASTVNGRLCYSQCFFVTSGEEKVFLDDNGYIVAGKTGTFNGKCYVVDAMGHVFSDKFDITVKYSFLQWIIRILLFQWLWD